MLRKPKRLSTMLALLAACATSAPASARADDLEARRKAMNQPASRAQLDELQRALQQQLQQPAPTTSSDTDAMESYATTFFTHVWREPKYRYMTGSIVLGELVLATMLWKRMAMNRATWNRQIATVREVSQSLREATRHYANAERDLLRSLSALEHADRQELLKSLEGTNTRARTMLERALNQPRPTAPATPGAPAPPPPLSVEEATGRLEKAYEQWQKQAANEARVLRAAGRPVTPPAAVGEVVAHADARTRAVTRLSYTSGEFFKFKNDGMKHMAQEARLNLGTTLSWRARAWRRARTGILLAAIPLVAVGIAQYYDRELERNRRIEDLNTASLQDRGKWINTMVPYFHRPLLFAVVRAWKRVQEKDGSLLKRFRCPFELRHIEEDNPHLQMIQAMAMQVLLEMEQENRDVVVENNQKLLSISPEFYRRLFRKILDSEGSALLNLEQKELDGILDDLAQEAFRSFDQLDERELPPPAPPVDGDGPGLGFRRDP